MPAASRTFLLTGVTGFLGKVMLEELVRRKDELGIERIGVVIRPLRGRRAEERFRREVVEAECFSLLPDGWSRIVTVLEGNLEQPGLALDPSHTKFLRDVTHVVHAAASIKFHLPVAVAARANITASLNMLEVARTLPMLARFVYVSTAYVTPRIDGTPIEEALVELPSPAADLYAACTQSDANEKALLAGTGHPNSYTLTKAIAERMLVECRGDVPLTIIRPSIITASRQHPFPGWIDSTAGYAAFVMLVGTGHLRALVANTDTHLDLIPVDEVAQRIVHVCLNDVDDVVVRHAVVGVAKSPTIAEGWDLVHKFFRIHPVNGGPRLRYVGPRGIRFTITDLLDHRLPILLAGRQSPAKKRQAEKLGERLSYLNEEFAYFTTRTFDFRTSLPLDDAFDGREFVTTINRGVFRHLLKGDDSEWVLAGRDHPGHGGDLRWVMNQPRGNFWIRAASLLATKIFARSVDSVTVDVPSFERARAAIPAGATLVVTPSHRSYLDFVLTTYLAFARPDLLPIPHIAATMEFARIPLLGRILESMHAFYLRRGEGRDPDLARRVHELIAGGNTLAFFIEGGRSRTGEFLAPRRGLLRCLQSTEKSCALLPIALTYERVPERDTFARELAGEPKQKMRLGALLSWAIDAWRGRVDLGHIHIACGTPVMLDATSEIHAVGHEVIDRLRDAMLASDVAPDGLQPDEDEASSGVLVELKSAR
ncbi:MAG: Glycerol-3-phosphate acyltransferase [Gemmatimonadetes bacterium]|nr:Glycerol-3-phosphate acyltransferase [Gemmatimonadota bacterium]